MQKVMNLNTEKLYQTQIKLYQIAPPKWFRWFCLECQAKKSIQFFVSSLDFKTDA